jgi:hypothetical protein
MPNKPEAMVKCKTQGCPRLVFPGQVYCWKHKLEKRNRFLERLRKPREEAK